MPEISQADVFISHAHEDKEVARPLAEALRQRGLTVWYDEYVLRLGDSLREVIERGLATARFGVVILSPSFFAKEWPKRELSALLSRETAKQMKVLLPVWHNLTLEEVVQHTPILADRLAVSTARGLASVVDQIMAVVEEPDLSESPPSTFSILSSLSQNVTERQLQIAEQHNKLLEAQLQPLFRFVPIIRSVGLDSFDALEIWNDGAPIESYQIWQASYIEVTREEPRQNDSPRSWTTRCIPSYYFIRRDYQGDARTGLLVTFYAWRDPVGSYSPGVNMTSEYERLLTEVQGKYGFSVRIEKRVFLHIYYVDRVGTKKDINYEIYPPAIGFGPQVPIRCKNVILGMGVEHGLKSLTADNLFDHWDSFDRLPDLSVNGQE